MTNTTATTGAASDSGATPVIAETTFGPACAVPDFNEGYAASSGPRVARADLSNEAIRLTRALHTSLPDDPEVTGLLALMLLTDARRAARTGPDGELVPLADQDRTRWDQTFIAEGVGLLTVVLSRQSRG